MIRLLDVRWFDIQRFDVCSNGGTQTEVARVIRSRRSVKHYRHLPVPEELLQELIALGLEAPSSHNLQARSIVAVTDRKAREALGHAAGGQPQPTEAPVVLAFVAESAAWAEPRDDIWNDAQARRAWSPEEAAASPTNVREHFQHLRELGLARESVVKDAMVAASFVMLAAEAAGLASNPMGGWDEEQVKHVIGIGDRADLHIALLLPLGYPAEIRLHPGRRSRALTSYRNVYGR
jgi:nitroreductase